jgi:hypothetical protein
VCDGNGGGDGAFSSSKLGSEREKESKREWKEMDNKGKRGRLYGFEQVH